MPPWHNYEIFLCWKDPEFRMSIEIQWQTRLERGQQPSHHKEMAYLRMQLRAGRQFSGRALVGLGLWGGQREITQPGSLLRHPWWKPCCSACSAGLMQLLVQWFSKCLGLHQWRFKDSKPTNVQQVSNKLPYCSTSVQVRHNRKKVVALSLGQNSKTFS